VFIDLTFFVINNNLTDIITQNYLNKNNDNKLDDKITVKEAIEYIIESWKEIITPDCWRKATFVKCNNDEVCMKKLFYWIFIIIFENRLFLEISETK
jgi:hypothetical protein